MKQSRTIILFTVLISMMCTTAFAHDISVANADGVTIYYNWTNDKTELSVSFRGISYHSYAEYYGSVVIPASVVYDGSTYSVTSIGSEAFRDCSGLTSITISNSVTSIGRESFAGCSSLTSVTIPNSVTSIGSYAFRNCSGLTSVIIPNSVMSIGESAFSDCSGLTSVTIPSSVTSIGSSAFYNCMNLKDVTLPDEITTIADYTFYGCTALESVHFPENLIQINQKAFSMCISLTEVDLPEKLTTMYNDAFEGCSELKTVISKSPTLIGRFSGCSNITKIESHVRKPDKYSGTFENKVKLFATLYVPVDTKEWYLETEGLKDFANIIEGDWGIPRDKEVINVTEPGTLLDRIKEITSEDVMTLTIKGGLNANDISLLNSLIDFDGFKDLVELNIRDVTLVSGDDPYAKVYIQTSDVGFTGNVYYCYISDTPKKTSSSNSTGLGGTSTSINLYGKNLAFAFYGTKYKRIVMPSSVTEIGDYTFSACSNLRSVEFSAPVAYIGDCAFGGANKLEELNCDFSQLQKAYLTAFGCIGDLSPWFSNLPDDNGIVYLGNVALAVKSPLTDATTLTFKEGTSAIAEYFYVSLFSDDLRAKYTSVKEYTVTLSLPSSVKYIGEKAFYSTNLNLVTDLPSCLEEIGDYAFFECPITKLTIPNSLETIGAYAFAYTNIGSLTIPCTVQTIGNFAFINNESLKSLVYDCPMENYGFDKGREMFSGCSSLSDLTIGNHVTVLPYNIFSGCTSLTEVTVPESVLEIVKRVDGLGSPFQNCTNLVKLNINCKNVMMGIVNFEECEVIVFGKTVESIAERAFDSCRKLTSVTIPNSVMSIGESAFLGCSGLTTVNSYITNLGEGISDWTFSDEVYKNAVLYVPSNMKSLYQTTNGWKNFNNIIEIPSLAPIEKEVNYSDENSTVNENTDLNGTVIDNVYYNISSDNGGFDTSEKCVVVNKTMSNEEIEEVFGKELFSDYMKEKFTGVVIEVPSGKGKVAVEAQTAGGMKLMVKVGAADPMEMELEGKLKMKVPYNVTEPTYVYIYAGQDASSSRTRATSKPSLKIYGISLEKEFTDFSQSAPIVTRCWAGNRSVYRKDVSDDFIQEVTFDSDLLSDIDDATYYLGYGLYDENGLVKVYAQQQKSFPMEESFYGAFIIGSDIPVGTYQVMPVFRHDESEDWKQVSCSNLWHVTAHVGEKSLYFKGAIEEDDGDYKEYGAHTIDGVTYKLSREFEKYWAYVLPYQLTEKYSGSVTVPNTVEFEGNTYLVREDLFSPFSNCEDLTSLSVAAEWRITSIDSCPNLAEIEIKQGNTIVISNCPLLESVEFPVTTNTPLIDNCSSLKKIKINCKALQFDWVGQVNWSDWSLPELTDIYFPSVVPPVLGGEGDVSANSHAVIHVKKGSLSAYKNSQWKLWNIVDDLPADNLTFGYCHSETTGNLGMALGKGGDNDQELAMRVPTQELEPYIGCQITNIQVYSPERSINDWGYEDYEYVFITKPGTDYVVKQPFEVIQGAWNTVVLDDPYTISGEDIFIGIGRHGQAAVRFEDDTYVADALWTRIMGSDYNICPAKEIGKWDYVKECVLKEGPSAHFAHPWPIKFAIEGESVPQGVVIRELDIEESINTEGALTRGAENGVQIKGVIRNRSQELVESYTVEWSIDGGEKQSKSFDTLLYPNESETITIDLPSALKSGKHSVSTNVTFVNNAQNGLEGVNMPTIELVDGNVSLDSLSGDVNCDGEVNKTDIDEMVNYITDRRSDFFFKGAADMNEDGTINVTDVVLILKQNKANR